MKRKVTLVHVAKKSSYVLVQKENGEILPGIESSGGREGSNSKLLFQHGN